MKTFGFGSFVELLYPSLTLLSISAFLHTLFTLVYTPVYTYRISVKRFSHLLSVFYEVVQFIVTHALKTNSKHYKKYL